MPSAPVVFGEYSFTSRNKAKLKCKSIRDRYSPAGVVTDPEDEKFLRALVNEHRHRDEKVGPGIEHFQVASNASIGARSSNLGIWIKQIGNPELVDFGYGGVIDWISDPSNQARERRRVERALRNAIRPITDAYLREQRQSGRPLTSALSGLTLDPSESIDVIHDSPRWGSLTRDFIESVGGTAVIATAPRDQNLGEVLVDAKVEAAWIQWHKERATLGLSTPEENRQRPSTS